MQNVLSRWLATKDLHDARADLLTRTNAQIHDHDAKVGPSFLMRDLAGTGLREVWRYEILPLLAGTPTDEHNRTRSTRGGG